VRERLPSLSTRFSNITYSTAENVVVFIWNSLVPHLPENSLYEIQLAETEKNSVIYRGEI
jgi:6-pyruvoyl-tetrahydropterin synthase